MAFFRKFFYRKPPDGLLEITERVYVFDSCFTTDVLEEDKHQNYIGDIVSQLRSHYADASYMLFNFREGQSKSPLANILSSYDMVVMDYPRQYVGCPILTMEMIHHFLRSAESWLSLGQHNVLIMHCERGGWAVLAFMLAGLLLYRKQFISEQRTLEMVYRQAPRELIQLLSPLNPMPSQIRYLHYISRRNVGSEWPPGDRLLTLDCVILRNIPGFNGETGCRPIFRIHGQDPLLGTNNNPTVLFSTPKRSKYVRLYKQADCELIKIDIHCHIRGDVVLECISLDADQEREEMMFRVMFNTAFIRSNILMLNRDEIDILWDAKDRFTKEFRAEVLLSEMDTANQLDPLELAGIGEKEGLPVEAFARVQEMFSTVDWLDPKGDAAVQFFQQLTSAEIIHLTHGLVSPTKKDLSIIRQTGQLELASISPTNKESDNVRNKSSNPDRSAVYVNKLESDSVQKLALLDPATISQGKSGNSIVHENISCEIHKEITHVVDADIEQASLLENTDEQYGPAQYSSPTMIMSQRFPVSWSSSALSGNSSPRSLSACPRFHSAPSALGITALLEDHAAFGGSENRGSTIITPTISNLTSAMVKTPSKPSSGQHLATDTPVVTKGTPPPPPPPPPQSQTLSSVSLVPSNAIMVLEAKDLSQPSQKHSGLSSLPHPSPPHKKYTLQLPGTTMLRTNHQHSSSKIAKESSPTSLVPHPPPLPVLSSTSYFDSSHCPHPDSMLVTNSTSLRCVAPPSPPPPPPPPPPSTLRLSPAISPAPPPPPPTAPTSFRLFKPPPSALNSSPSRPPTPSVASNSYIARPAAQPPPPASTSSAVRPDAPPPALASTSSPVPPAAPPLPPSSTSSAIRSSAPPPPPALASTSSPVPPAAPPLPPSSTSSAIRSSAPPPPPPPGITHMALPPPPPPPYHSSKQSSIPMNISLPSPPAPPPPRAPSIAKDANHHGGGCKGASGNIIPPPAPPGSNANCFGTKGRGPAPPSGPMSKILQSGQATSRRSNLKPLHWVKVTRAMQGSLWADAQKADEASKAPVFDMSELENLFSAVLPKSDAKRSDKSGSRASGTKQEKIHLIDLRRANNCGIMLTKVKMPLPDLMSAILALDDTVLDADQVDNLIKFTPTKEEIELLKGYKGDKQVLGECEQFFMELMKLPRVDSKLRVFSFKIQFRSQVSDLKHNLNIVNSCAEEIRGSVKLKRIMQTILSLGNALNQGTARGSAVGFRLDSLLKLSDTRARNNKMTLMHYLSKVLLEKLPELLDFPKDLASLELAAKIQLKCLAEEMQAINKGLEKVEQELTTSENDGSVSEIFRKTLNDFLSGAEAEVRSLTSLYANVGRNADALALYFGEDPARCPFEQVVRTLQNFVTLFIRSHEENCKQLDLEKKKAQKEAELEKTKQKLENEKAKRESENEISLELENEKAKREPENEKNMQQSKNEKLLELKNEKILELKNEDKRESENDEDTLQLENEKSESEMENEKTKREPKNEKDRQQSENENSRRELENDKLKRESENEKDSRQSENEKSYRESENEKTKRKSENEKDRRQLENEKSQRESENEKDRQQPENEKSHRELENEKTKSKSENEKDRRKSKNEKSQRELENEKTKRGSENEKDKRQSENEKSQLEIENEKVMREPENEKEKRQSKNEKLLELEKENAKREFEKDKEKRQMENEKTKMDPENEKDRQLENDKVKRELEDEEDRRQSENEKSQRELENEKAKRESEDENDRRESENEKLERESEDEKDRRQSENEKSQIKLEIEKAKRESEDEGYRQENEKSQMKLGNEKAKRDSENEKDRRQSKNKKLQRESENEKAERESEDEKDRRQSENEKSRRNLEIENAKRDFEDERDRRENEKSQMKLGNKKAKMDSEDEKDRRQSENEKSQMELGNEKAKRESEDEKDRWQSENEKPQLKLENDEAEREPENEKAKREPENEKDRRQSEKEKLLELENENAKREFENQKDMQPLKNEKSHNELENEKTKREPEDEKDSRKSKNGKSQRELENEKAKRESEDKIDRRQSENEKSHGELKNERAKRETEDEKDRRQSENEKLQMELGNEKANRKSEDEKEWQQWENAKSKMELENEKEKREAENEKDRGQSENEKSHRGLENEKKRESENDKDRGQSKNEKSHRGLEKEKRETENGKDGSENEKSQRELENEKTELSHGIKELDISLESQAQTASAT